MSALHSPAISGFNSAVVILHIGLKMGATTVLILGLEIPEIFKYLFLLSGGIKGLGDYLVVHRLTLKAWLWVILFSDIPN